MPTSMLMQSQERQQAHGCKIQEHASPSTWMEESGEGIEGWEGKERDGPAARRAGGRLGGEGGQGA
eukprot:2015028-Rhodomonas_salina.1